MRTRGKQFSLNVAMIVVNVIIFFIVDITGGSQNTLHMIHSGAANAGLIVDEHEYYRLFTSMFLHFGMTHLANNMLVLFVIGDNLERAVGKIRYLLIYLLSGVGGNILSCYLEYRQGVVTVSAGASGAIFGVMGAMIYVLHGEADCDYGWIFPLFRVHQFRSRQCSPCGRADLWICSGTAYISQRKN